MRAVGAHHEQELEQKFVGVGEAIVGHIPQMAVTILATDLAELAGPIGENTGKTSVRQVGICGAAAAVEAAPDSPAAVYAGFGLGIKAENGLGLEGGGQGNLIACAPEEVGAGQKRGIKGAGERLPTE